MNNKLIIPREIVTVDERNTILQDYAIEIENDRIKSFVKVDEIDKKNFAGEIINAENLTVIPGFIQTHIHLCQTLFRGLADDLELLDWLQLRIFPYENAHSPASLKASASAGILELMLSGTTTILDMGTLRHQEIIFNELINSGMRAFAGKCLIDSNDLFPSFKSGTKSEIDESVKLAKEYHNHSDGRIKYGFAPRFILSCSDNLLKEISSLQDDFPGSLYHTHASENKFEVEAIRKRCGKENIEHFESLGILNEHTVLAHCIHVNEKEIAALKNNNVRVAHCPSSNLKLGSGIVPIPRYLSEGISVSLGADGAPCNNNLSIFNEMRLSSLIQKPIHGPTSMDALTTFRMATIDGARALHIDNEVGSIEVGKKADLVMLDLNTIELPYHQELNNVYSKIVYSASMENVHSVIIDGKFVVQNHKSTVYDAEQMISDCKDELKKLIDRV